MAGVIGCDLRQIYSFGAAELNIDITIFRRFVVSGFVAAWIGLPYAQAADIQLKNQYKAESISQDILNLLQEGKSQDLIVNFDMSAIAKREKEKQKLKGLHENDERIENETRAEIKKLKSSFFKRRPFNKLKIILNYSVLPATFVRVPDMHVLQAILDDPNVESVHPDRIFTAPSEKPLYPFKPPASKLPLSTDPDDTVKQED